MQWSVDDMPAGLSITNRHGQVRKIKEFSTNGQLLHILTLPQDVLSPPHAIYLSIGHFLVSHGVAATHLHRVCLIGSDNTVMKSLSGLKDADGQYMSMPYHLAIDGNGFRTFGIVLQTTNFMPSIQLLAVSDAHTSLRHRGNALRLHCEWQYPLPSPATDDSNSAAAADSVNGTPHAQRF